MVITKCLKSLVGNKQSRAVDSINHCKKQLLLNSEVMKFLRKKFLTKIFESEKDLRPITKCVQGSVSQRGKDTGHYW